MVGRRVRQPSPSAWNARIALRTAWAVQPTARPIWAGPLPSALASRTWDRRRVNASADFRPRLRPCRSAAVRERTNIRGFIRSGYDYGRHSKPSYLILH